jgi:DNA invertase Pin-like site-specific DNA recombinase
MTLAGVTSVKERIAGIQRARKGKRLGRPRKVLPDRIASLRARGCSWRTIARQLGCSARTARRAGQKPPKPFCPTSRGETKVGSVQPNALRDLPPAV